MFTLKSRIKWLVILSPDYDKILMKFDLDTFYMTISIYCQTLRVGVWNYLDELIN